MIRLTGVYRSFGPLQALLGVSFTLHRGEVLGLVGHRWAGKTTVLRLIAAALPPSGGSIDVVDPEIDPARDGRSFKSRLGFAPEDPALYPFLTGNETLKLVGTLHQLDADVAVRRIGRYAETFGLQGVLDQPTHTYSRGMKRKLSLIVSILHDPLYWLIDEPTEALDAAAIRVLKELIAEQKRDGRAVLVATRQFGHIRGSCDRFVILREGRVVFDGDPEALRRAIGAEPQSLDQIYQILR
jgi:ABC-type multidrug transport system ATPase subunit